MRPRRALSALLPLVPTVAVFVGCSGLLGIEDVSPWDGGAADGTSPQDATPEQDAPSGQDATSEQAGDSSGDVAKDSAAEAPLEAAPDTATSDAPPCSGTTLYVSTTGDDSNPGCSSSAPKKTLGATITAAQAAGTVTTIEVCAGTYAVHQTLAAPVSLLGGYDCAKWQRTATYGYPSFDPTNATILAYAGTSTSGATLTVTGTTVKSSTVIDGFTIQGPASGSFATTGAAVLVSGGSAPTLTNDLLVGGGTTYTGTASGDTTAASAAVAVSNMGAPTLTNDTLRGGSGTTKAGGGTGSAGLYADGTNGAVTVSSCTLHGGTGQAQGPSGTGSTGVVIEGSVGPGPVYSLTTSAIDGGSGQGTNRATRGVFVDMGGNASLDLRSCVVDGGDEVNNPAGATAGSVCPHGVEFLAAGNLNAYGNRIYGGRCNLTSPANSASLYGMFVGVSAVLVAENNLIHMGTSSISHGAAALGISSAAGPRVIHNTLIAGPAGSATIAALWIESGASNAAIQNNILAASGLAPNAAGLLVSCGVDAGAPAIQSFQNNLVFGATSGLMQWENCNGQAEYATIDALTAELLSTQTGITASGNVTVASSCGTDTGCVPTAACTSQALCLSAVFAGFDTASYGYANLFPTGSPFVGGCPATAPPSGYGWPIAATPSCKVARSSLNDSAMVLQDVYGSCRSTSAPTMGAAEYVGSCQ